MIINIIIRSVNSRGVNLWLHSDSIRLMNNGGGGGEMDFRFPPISAFFSSLRQVANGASEHTMAQQCIVWTENREFGSRCDNRIRVSLRFPPPITTDVNERTVGRK